MDRLPRRLVSVTPALSAALALGLTGCLPAWSPDGLLYACTASACPAGFTCDDGVCCVPGGAPACPTLPNAGACPGGAQPTTLHADRDGDGFGDPATARPFCRSPIKEAWVLDAADCDDGDATIKPTGSESCNGKDDDCDGAVDEGLSPRSTWYRDGDGDGFGVAGAAVDACSAPPGYADKFGDCADADQARHPGAEERCNGEDDNCDGRADEGPFADAYDPGVDSPADFPCANAGLGQCAAGNLQCRGAALVCVAQRAPTTDACDGLDDDCDGRPDNPPGCGGPQAFIAGPGTRGAQRLSVASFADLVGRCAKGYSPAAPATATTWLNPEWIFSTPRAANQNETPTAGTLVAQVWWMEAPPGAFWDLSGPGAALHLALGLTVLNPADLPDGGTDAFGTRARHAQPVVTLCSRSGALLRQYLPVAGGLQGNASSFDALIPLGGDASWAASGTGPLSRVERVEVVTSTRAPSSAAVYPQTTVTAAFLPDAGFFGGSP